MKKIVLLIISLALFFILAHRSYAAPIPPFDLLRDLLKILFSFQSAPDIPAPPDVTPIIPPATTPPLSDINQYLPKPLNPISPNLTAYNRNDVLTCLNKKTTYELATGYTGIPWQILAAIHYLEASCGEGSLVSGRAIGTCEPDLAGECSTGRSGPGIPIPLPGGCCGMASLSDSAIYAGKHLQGKIGKNPVNFQDLVIAFDRYNGLGNQNCGVTPYKSCPRYFESEDHIYPLNWFDTPRHNTMYLVYCADHVKCNPPKIFARPGALTVLRILSGN